MNPRPTVHITFDDLPGVQTDKVVQASERRAELRRQRQARQAAQRRELMLDAALALFQEAGAHGFNMRELGLRAGYTPGALYAYFDGKAAIFEALRERLLHQLLLELQLSGSRRRSGASARDHQAVLAMGKLEADAAAFLQLSLRWWNWLAQDPLRLRLLLALDQPVAGKRPLQAAKPGPSSDAVSAVPFLLSQLRQATSPCNQALQAMGLTPERAEHLHEASLVWGVGLLVLHPPQPANPALGERFLAGVLERLLAIRPEPDPVAPDGGQLPQADLFGR